MIQEIRGMMIGMRESVRFLFDRYALKSYAQEGEDILLQRVLGDKRKGFYVDVGAHHPMRFSNTYFFYKRGWSGINIDAMPGSMRMFKKLRPRDINLEIAIAKDNREMTFFIFNEPALNSFDAKIAEEHATHGYRIIRRETIHATTLADILTTYLPSNQNIDVLSIDVEGLDLEVLQSNNWQLFRPEYILTECLGRLTIEDIIAGEVYRFLVAQGYKLFAKTVNTVFFRLIVPT